jgi:hypothetical protein
VKPCHRDRAQMPPRPAQVAATPVPAEAASFHRMGNHAPVFRLNPGPRRAIGRKIDLSNSQTDIAKIVRKQVKRITKSTKTRVRVCLLCCFWQGLCVSMLGQENLSMAVCTIPGGNSSRL